MAKKKVMADVGLVPVLAKHEAILPWRRRGKRGGLFYRILRSRTVDRLVEKHGYTELEAEAAVARVTEVEIDDLSNSHNVGDLGDGSLLDKIISFITSEKFLQLIEALIKIILAFSSKK